MARCTLFWKLEILALDQQAGIVGDDVAQRLHPGPFALGEIAEHMHRHQFLYIGFSDADAHALVVVADMGGDRAQAIVTGIAAPDLDPHLGRLQIDLVVKHHDLARLELVEARGLLHRAARFVHESAGQQQQDTLARQRAFHRYALEFAPPRRHVVAAGNRLHRHETDIVAVFGVACAGIAEADEEQHGFNGRAAALSRKRKRRQ